VLIQDMNRQKSLDLVSETQLGRIACAHGAQPYVTPFSFAYHEGFIYSFATIGQKVEWMRANPLVCVEVEIASRREWQTVVIFGRFQELHETRELTNMRKFAHDLLARTAMWWEPGAVITLHRGVERRLDAVYFRISIDEITGHQALAEEPVAESETPTQAARQTSS
jgi:uncharacterized protein